MNAFERLPFYSNLVLVNEVGINAATLSAQATCIIGQIWVIFYRQRRLFLCLVEMALNEAAVIRT